MNYIESNLRQASSFESLRESDMISMLSGDGGPQVDLVLYMIFGRKC